MHSKHDWIKWVADTAADIKVNLRGVRNLEEKEQIIREHLNDELAIVMSGYDAVDVLDQFPQGHQIVDRVYEKQWTNPNGIKFPDHMETLIALAKEILATNVHRTVYEKKPRKRKTE